MSIIDGPGGIASLTAELENCDLSQPVGMLNLLKFRDRAEYPAQRDEPPRTGREAYRVYAALAFPLIEALGAKPILSQMAWFVGDPAEWDMAFVVQYQRASDILEMLGKPEYHAIEYHRDAALADSRLLMMEFTEELDV